MPLDQEALQTLRGARGTVRPVPRRRRWWWIAGGLAVLAIALVLVAGRRPLVVQTVSAVALPANAGPAAVLDASGFVVARRQATVSAKVTGKVMEVLIEEGMRVKAGQVLARLDASQSSLQHTLANRQVDAAQSNLQQVRVRLADAERTLARNESLMQSKLISQAALDAARADVEALRAQGSAAEAQIAVAKSALQVRAQDLEDLVIRAPFSGVVISKDAQPGEMVSPISAGGGFTRTGIATIVDMDSREIEVDVNESFINRVRDGQQTEATLDAYPDWRIPGHVLSVVPAADRQKATVRVRIAFDALEPRILPDMGVKVRFLGDEPAPGQVRPGGTVLVPAEALVNDAGKDYAWRLDGERARRVPVTLGSMREGSMEVSAGLKVGDLLITAPPATLTDGARVRAAPPVTGA
jgi:RND family efflux transporter MFP subunit